MAEKIDLEDEEGVIKGPHHYLIERKSLDKIEREIYNILAEIGAAPLSEIWRKLNCHLWEVTAALIRLKKKGLVEETDITSEIYARGKT